MAQAPQADKGCGTFGQLLMIVVAVVVAVYTAGAGSWALGLEAMQAGSGMADAWRHGRLGRLPAGGHGHGRCEEVQLGRRLAGGRDRLSHPPS